MRAGPTIGLLAGAHFSHHVLMAILVPLLPFIRDEFGLTYAQTGLVTSAFTISYGASQLPAGWLADRIGPRFLLLFGITGVAVAGAIVGVAPVYAAVILALVLMGIAGGGYHPSASAVIANLVPPHRRGQALGVHIIGGSTSYFLAPLIAAGVVSAVGWRGTFLSLSVPVALLGIAVFVLVTMYVHGHPSAGFRVPTSSGDARERPKEGAWQGERVDDAAHRRRGAAHMTVFLVLTGIMGAGVGSVIPYIPLHLVDARGVDERIAAGVISVIFAAGFFAAPLGGMLSDRLGRVRVMIATGLLTGPAIALVVLAPFPVPLAIALLFVGVLMFVRMPSSEAHIISEVSVRRRSTVLGIYFFASSEAGAVLTPLLGAAIDRWGFTAGIVGMGAVVAGVAIVCGFALIVLSRRS